MKPDDDNDDTSRRTLTESSRTLTEEEVKAIREAVLERAPLSMMDTQKIVLENKSLREERDRLRSWLAVILEKLREDTGLHEAIREEDVKRS